MARARQCTIGYLGSGGRGIELDHLGSCSLHISFRIPCPALVLAETLMLLIEHAKLLMHVHIVIFENCREVVQNTVNHKEREQGNPLSPEVPTTWLTVIRRQHQPRNIPSAAFVIRITCPPQYQHARRVTKIQPCPFCLDHRRGVRGGNKTLEAIHPGADLGREMKIRHQFLLTVYQCEVFIDILFISWYMYK
ncbi:hypothetical protein F5Y16DRAFT_317184 [Xylariaceae sp. FL0255]|nr:hypothetical protein F5Y16DRAFT_317184 [Xylariaceae sp. FL0255]